MLLIAGALWGSVIFVLCIVAAISTLIESIRVNNERRFYATLFVAYVIGVIIAGVGTRELLRTLLTVFSG